MFLAAATAYAAGYTGSQACEPCHAGIYARWSKTRMANVVVDPKSRPEVVSGDFSKPNPLVTFGLKDVAFVYGTKWKQRYFKKVGDDYFVFPAQWDVRNAVWRPYSAKLGTDWWVEKYPADQMRRPTGPLCDGCHSVNYNVRTKQVTEWNVGCEKCHGPGGDHVAKPSRANIVNPIRLDYVRANDVCIQCHSQGRPKANPIEGQYYDWAVGFEPGRRLSDVWELEEHKLGETTFTHWPEDSAHKNRMQGNDFVQSVMYERGITCFGCHDVHGTGFSADTIRPGNDLCLTCHGPQSPAGPRGSTEHHSNHAATSTGSDCVECHMPKIAQTIADVNVRSHTFRFVTPAATAKYKIPNACGLCHKDKPPAWAEAELAKWPEFSPWRVANP
ncbi:MAG: cytochrome c3 family protein [Acidobacteriota bacterium]|nr:cytochrome c3 family protein [Acidobacteriota bacterium]